MKRILLSSACFTALAVAVFAQADGDYQGWMKTIGGAMGSLRKNLDAKNGEAASADAKRIEDAFAKVHDFWQKKSVDNAMMFAMDAGNGFREVAEEAAAGKFEDASATLKKASASCGGCHTAHREKSTDGAWKIK